MSDPSDAATLRESHDDRPSLPAPPPSGRRWAVSALLFALTLLSTTWVGAEMTGEPVHGAHDLLRGLPFSLPLLAILVAHEFGHFIAGRIHGVDISPPYFVPMPLSLVGTMGAVIRMRGSIRRRNALLDVGAAGPLAGLVVAIPVLIVGLLGSEVRDIPSDPSGTIIEGRSLLYWGLVTLVHGVIPPGRDVFLSQTAFAGWAGLLVTMINLIPVGQLDGGHVAYALFGKPQDRYSERVRKLLPLLGISTSAYYVATAYAGGKRGGDLSNAAFSGVHWLVWAAVLFVLTRVSGREHPETGIEPLSPARRAVAVVTLAFFVLLFMPSWVRLP